MIAGHGNEQVWILIRIAYGHPPRDKAATYRVVLRSGYRRFICQNNETCRVKLALWPQPHRERLVKSVFLLRCAICTNLLRRSEEHTSELQSLRHLVCR